MRRQSPFPGMDPFLEQPAIWAGVDHRLITTLSDILTERLWPAYFVQIEERVYVIAPEHPDRRTIVPDVFVVRGTMVAATTSTAETITAPTLVAPLLDLEVRDWYIEIHDTRSREVITTIEVLSPFNKASGTPGREDFLRKRSRVMGSHANWIEIDLLRAGERPIEVVGKSDYYALLKRGDITDHFEVWYSDLRDPLHDSDYLVRQANTLVKTPLVLDVDQFEELFTICENEAARQAFIANLLALIDSPGLRHVVILTMRSEYASYVARFQKLNDAFDTARLPVAPMVPSELREAIEEPARSAGLKIEPGVVDDLVADVVGEPAALPLLQFTLLKLWESRERNRVTREAYQRLGGGRIALERSADEFYDGLSPEQQTTVRRLLLRMVRPADGLEFTNNRVQISELQLIGEPIERIDEVLNKLVAARLIRLTPAKPGARARLRLLMKHSYATGRSFPIGWSRRVNCCGSGKT